MVILDKDYVYGQLVAYDTMKLDIVECFYWLSLDGFDDDMLDECRATYYGQIVKTREFVIGFMDACGYQEMDEEECDDRLLDMHIPADLVFECRDELDRIEIEDWEKLISSFQYEIPLQTSTGKEEKKRGKEKPGNIPAYDSGNRKRREKEVIVNHDFSRDQHRDRGKHAVIIEFRR